MGTSLSPNLLIMETCLHLETIIGDLREEIVIVGGLVPDLIVDQGSGVEPHRGTMDLDVGLASTIFEEERYEALEKRLREAGFKPDVKDGNPVHQRWRLQEVTIDFLTPPLGPEDKPGRLKHLAKNLAAFIIPGLQLAFEDAQKVTVEGRTVEGATVEREILVCGPAAYVVLKALASYNRNKDRDAYDLYYVLKNYEGGTKVIAERLIRLAGNPLVGQALAILKNDFAQPDRIGPLRVAAFSQNPMDDELKAEVAGSIWKLLKECDQ